MPGNDSAPSVEQRLAGVQWYIAHPDAVERDLGLVRTVSDLFLFFEELRRSPEQVLNLIEVARALRAAIGPGRAIAEERMMNHLYRLTQECTYLLEEAGVDELEDREPTEPLPKKVRAAGQIVLSVCGYALECFDFKRSHDSFGGKRKLLAFEILAAAARAAQLPEAVRRAREAVRSGRGTVVRGALEFFEEYYVRRKLKPSAEVVEELETLVERTASRWTAFGALNVLVKAGVISELGALDRMGDWKEQHGHSTVYFLPGGHA